MTVEGPTVNTPEELQAVLKDRLIASGEYTKLLELIHKRLRESDWEDTMRDVARERARGPETPSAQKLVEFLEPKAKESIPAKVREEVEELLRQFVERNVQDD